MCIFYLCIIMLTLFFIFMHLFIIFFKNLIGLVRNSKKTLCLRKQSTFCFTDLLLNKILFCCFCDFTSTIFEMETLQYHSFI